jgi:hypothetical protein
MKGRLRIRLRVLEVYAAITSCAFIVLATAAFRQTSAPQRFDEITVQRINVVDASGTLRLVISNKDRMHPGVIDGKTINRPRPVAGLLFFNDEGDEVGGLTFSGREQDGVRRANSGVMFDQLKQDQTVGIEYNEANGQRSAGLSVWDRPDTRLSALIDQLNEANAIADPAMRDARLQTIRAAAPRAPRRVFVGKSTDKSAGVTLTDAQGKTRLTMKVTADGEPVLEFLDADGKVVQRLPSR